VFPLQILIGANDLRCLYSSLPDADWMPRLTWPISPLQLF